MKEIGTIPFAAFNLIRFGVICLLLSRVLTTLYANLTFASTVGICLLTIGAVLVIIGLLIA